MEEREKKNYFAYLIRCWREDEDSPWRAMLENPHTGEKVHFADFDQLWTFFQTKLEPPDD